MVNQASVQERRKRSGDLQVIHRRNIRPGASPRATSQRGFSYVEVLVATMLLAVALVPAVDAVRTATQFQNDSPGDATRLYHLNAKLERVLAEPFSQLDRTALAAGSIAAPTAYSDTSGAANRRLVYMTRYDTDNADADNDPLTGGDPDLLWIRVELEGTGQRLETLAAR